MIVRLAIAGALIVGLGAPAPAAQDRRPAATTSDKTAAVPAPAPDKGPAAIPLPEIADRFEGLTAFLRSVDALLVADAAMLSIEGRLPAMATRLAERRKATDQTLGSAPALATSLATLDGLTDSWQPLRAELAEWLATLRVRATALESARDKLTETRETWIRTGEAARSARAPAPVVARIDGVLSLLSAAQHRLELARSATLILQDKVAEAARIADDALASIGASRTREAGRLFVRDGPSVWSAALRVHPWTELPARVRESAQAYADDVRQFVRVARARLVAQAVLLVVLAGLLLAARRHVRRWAPDDATESILTVLANPVAAALVLTLLASPWIHHAQPRAAWTLAQTGALVPMLVVMRGWLGRTRVPGLYMLGGFFLFDLLRGLASVLPLLEYALFLFEMLAAAALVGWLLFTQAGRRVAGIYGTPRQVRVLTAACRLALVCFLGALVSAGLGNMGLARLVGGGALTSAYVGLLVHAGYRLLTALTMLALRVWPLRELRMVQQHRALVQARVLGILRTVGALIWLGGTLEYFSVLRPFAATVRAALEAGWTQGAVHVSVGEVLAFGITVWASFLLSSFVRFVLAEDIFPRMRVDDGVSYAVRSLLHYALLFVGFLLAIAALGVDMNRFTVLGGAFGVGLGFGLQSIVNNFVSGLVVLFERPIRVGDIVEVGGVSGSIGRIGIRASTIRTWDGGDLIVPNSMLVAERVLNRTPVGRRVALTLAVRVAYGPAPDKVLALLSETARAQPGIATYPTPVALFVDFGAGGLAFEVRAWTSPERSNEVRSELGVAIYAALQSAGMELALPQHVIRVEGRPQ
jgi:small-conductance mechanosensitive channel